MISYDINMLLIYLTKTSWNDENDCAFQQHNDEMMPALDSNSGVTNRRIDFGALSINHPWLGTVTIPPIKMMIWEMVYDIVLHTLLWLFPIYEEIVKEYN